MAERNPCGSARLERSGPRTPVGALRRRQSVRELDMLVEDDRPLLVAHDVVAMKAIAELGEVLFALGSLVALDRKHRVANLLRIRRPCFVDADGQSADR